MTSLFSRGGFLFCVAILVVVSAGNVNAQTTAFTYQGRLFDGSGPANGNYDFEFKLYDASTGGNQHGSTIQLFTVPVSNGKREPFSTGSQPQYPPQPSSWYAQCAPSNNPTPSRVHA